MSIAIAKQYMGSGIFQRETFQVYGKQPVGVPWSFFGNGRVRWFKSLSSLCTLRQVQTYTYRHRCLNVSLEIEAAQIIVFTIRYYEHIYIIYDIKSYVCV